MGNYIDIAYVQETIGKTFSATTTPSTTQINRYIQLAEIDFEREVGSFLEDDYTEYLICGRDGLYVNNFPLNSITSISVSNNHRTNPEYTDLDSDNYRIINSENGKVRLLSPRLKTEYKIVYNAGYDSESIPDNIKYLVFLYVMRYVFKNTVLNTEGSFGNSQVIIDVDVYKEITGKSMYSDGLQTMENLISEEKGKLLHRFKTYWVI